MSLAPDKVRRSTENILVCLARNGDRDAFAELVSRRQAWIRTLMRRCCGDVSLADDLSQEIFAQAWRTVPGLRQPDRFAAWLKRLAINTWLQHVRRNDPLREPRELDEGTGASSDAAALEMDLDGALATLRDEVRLCIVLSYHEAMTHDEIAAATGLPLGTVKSHIRRGTERLRKLLSAYVDAEGGAESS